MTELTPVDGQAEPQLPGGEETPPKKDARAILDDLQEWSQDLQALIQYWPDMAESAGWHVIKGEHECETIARRSAWAINRQQERLIGQIEKGLEDVQVLVARLKKGIS